MKVAILTFHRAHNYGAVLQCYALYRALSEKGISCDVLDYSPDYFYKMYNILPYKHSLKTSIGTYVCHILLRSMLEERVENFNRFISEYERILSHILVRELYDKIRKLMSGFPIIVRIINQHTWRYTICSFYV